MLWMSSETVIGFTLGMVRMTYACNCLWLVNLSMGSGGSSLFLSLSLSLSLGHIQMAL